jgi:hypothetical protein
MSQHVDHLTSDCGGQKSANQTALVYSPAYKVWWLKLNYWENSKQAQDQECWRH